MKHTEIDSVKKKQSHGLWNTKYVRKKSINMGAGTGICVKWYCTTVFPTSKKTRIFWQQININSHYSNYGKVFTTADL